MERHRRVHPPLALPRNARLLISDEPLTSRDAGFNSDELCLVVMIPGHEGQTRQRRAQFPPNCGRLQEHPIGLARRFTGLEFFPAQALYARNSTVLSVWLFGGRPHQHGLTHLLLELIH